MRALLDAGVDPDAVYHNDLTALMWARATAARIPCACCSLRARAPTASDDRGKTALDIAREQDQAETAALLETAVRTSAAH